MQARLASIVPTGTSSFTARATAPAAARAAAGPPAALPAGTPTDGPSALADYRQLLGTQLAKLLDAAEAVGGQVLAATRVLAEGFEREAAVVEAIGVCQVWLLVANRTFWPSVWMVSLSAARNDWASARMPHQLPAPPFPSAAEA